MLKQQKNRMKQNAKVILIISCVFAVISSILFVVMIYDLPQIIEGRAATKYLYENGIEVDAYIKEYYDDYGPTRPADPYMRIYSGRFHIVYEYVDDNNRTYTDEFLDTVECRSKDALRAREQYIKQIVADGTTMKMLIADNGLCCLSVYKESLIAPTTLVIYIVLIPISSVVLGLSIFGIVRQSRKLKLLKKCK